MNPVGIGRFSELLKSIAEGDIISDVTLGGRLVLDQAGSLSIHYAPFDHIQRGARLAIVGITPGAQQAQNALAEARRHLLAGAAEEVVLGAAKTYASFSGPMRTNLVAMLDHVGLNRWLGVTSTAEVWNVRTNLVHFTSALRYPVFLNGKNYTGAPSMTAVPILRNLMENCLGEEVASLTDALWVPLGPSATEALDWFVQQGRLPRERLLSGLPHPSGANAERIAYFLGRKDRAALSGKTNADRLDEARAQLVDQVSRLMRESFLTHIP
jgi:hypothetical protein